jgi:hypothetical protein
VSGSASASAAASSPALNDLGGNCFFRLTPTVGNQWFAFRGFTGSYPGVIFVGNAGPSAAKFADANGNAISVICPDLPAGQYAMYVCLADGNRFHQAAAWV